MSETYPENIDISYRPEDLDMIIVRGGTRQRIKVLFEHYALKETKLKGILTDIEEDALRRKIRTGGQIRLFNRYVEKDRVVRLTIRHLNELRLNYKLLLTKMTAPHDQWIFISNSANTYNRILSAVQDERMKKQIREIIMSSPPPAYAIGYKINEAGEIEADPDNMPLKRPRGESDTKNIHQILSPWSKGAIFYGSAFKALARALREYMNDGGFDIKPYRDHITALEDDLRQNIERGIYNGFTCLEGTDYFPDFNTIPEDDGAYKYYRYDFLGE